MSNRVDMLAAHFQKRLTSTGVSAFKSVIGKKSPEDVVIISALRTPLTRARKGGLAQVHQEEMLASVLKAVMEKSKVDPALVEDIQVGNVLPIGGGATLARIAGLNAGFPDSTSVATVNRQCSSGLQAVANIVHAIQSGSINIGIGAGVESMTMNYLPENMMPNVSAEMIKKESAAECLLPMGETSERVVDAFKISRAEQDAFAMTSHAKAAAAQKNGWFDGEIHPVKTKEGVVVSKDDGIREGTILEGLAKLKPVFRENGTTTAGNASQVSDGAAAVLLMKRSTAEALSLKPIGKFVGFGTAGVPPGIMGIGPAFAIPLVLKKAGLGKDQVDIYEINEAFASQAVYCVKKLGIPEKKVNPVGGAIAFGHPLGATGARMIATVLNQLERRNEKIGVVSMCIGTGMGAAAIIERE